MVPMRKPDCTRYNDCLMKAAKAEAVNFSCPEKCPGYKRKERNDTPAIRADNNIVKGLIPRYRVDVALQKVVKTLVTQISIRREAGYDDTERI